MEDPYRSGFNRISSAPRLSISSYDVFNLRNSQLTQLTQLSRSSPGIYNSDGRQQKVICDPVNSKPKSILLKPKQLDSITELNTLEEKEDKKSYYSVRLEIQFTAFVFLFFILVIVIPISMIVIGSIYVHNCPAQIMIPIFLIVGGATFLCSIGLVKRVSSEDEENCYRKIYSFTLMFQLGWLIAGCYWIYGNYQPDYTNEESSSYCHKTLYTYSFWLLNSIFLSFVLFVAVFTVYVLFGREQTDPGAKV